MVDPTAEYRVRLGRAQAEPTLDNVLALDGNSALGEIEVAPDGASYARPLSDIAWAPRGEPPFALLAQSAEYAIPATPAAGDPEEFASWIVDLSRWGALADQMVQQHDAVITKPGPNGTRVATVSPLLEAMFPVPPTPDDPLVGVVVGCEAIGEAGNTQSKEEGADYGVIPVEVGGQSRAGTAQTNSSATTGRRLIENRARFVRFYASRTSDAWTPEQTALFAGYKIHFNVTGIDFRVPGFTRTYDIPAALGAVIANEVIDLRTYGINSKAEDYRLLFEFLRGGEVIRAEVATAIITGRTYDPPTYPVCFNVRGYVPTDAGDYDYNGNNGTIERQYYQFGDPANGFEPKTGGGPSGGNPSGDGWVDRDVWHSVTVNHCTAGARTQLLLQIWRHYNDNGPTEYIAQQGDVVPTEIPAGAKDNCQLRVSLLYSGRMSEGVYPFSPAPSADDSGAPTLYGLQRRMDIAIPFVSDEIVGTGAPQATAHGRTDAMGVAAIPVKVVIMPTQWGAGAVAISDVSADATDVTATVTLGVSYRILTWL